MKNAPRIHVLSAVLLAVALFVVGCGGGGDDGGGDAGVAQIAPANAFIYADAVLRPEGTQKEQLDSFLSAVLDTSDPGQKITELIDRAFKDSGEARSFDEDIDPWLGDTGGVFTLGFQDDPPTLVAAEATDTEAGVEVIESESTTNTPKEYKGVEYAIDEDGDAFGAIEGLVAVGDEAAYKAAIDASQGESLADSDRFKSDTEDVPAEALGSAYIDLQGVIKQTAAEQNAPPGVVEDVISKLGIGDSLVVSASAGEKSVGLDLGGLGGDTADAPSALLADLPSDAWFAVGVSDVGGRVDTFLKTIADAGIPGLTEDTIAIAAQDRAGLDIKKDLTAWLGGAAVFVRGTDPAALDGALVLESTDDAAAARAMNSVRESIEARGQGTPQPLELGSGGNGFTITDPTVPQPINFVQQNGKVVIGVGDVATQQALQPSQTLAQAPSFTAASGTIGGGGPQLYLSVPEAVAVLAQTPDTEKDPDFARALPYLERLAYLTAGGGEDGLKIIVGAK